MVFGRGMKVVGLCGDGDHDVAWKGNRSGIDRHIERGVKREHTLWKSDSWKRPPLPQALRFSFGSARTTTTGTKFWPRQYSTSLPRSCAGRDDRFCFRYRSGDHVDYSGSATKDPRVDTIAAGFNYDPATVTAANGLTPYTGTAVGPRNAGGYRREPEHDDSFGAEDCQQPGHQQSKQLSNGNDYFWTRRAVFHAIHTVRHFDRNAGGWPMTNGFFSGSTIKEERMITFRRLPMLLGAVMMMASAAFAQNTGLTINGNNPEAFSLTDTGGNV